MFAFLSTLFGSLAGFFAQWMTKKAALGTAAVAVILTLTAGFWFALQTLMSSVLIAAPALCELSWLMPSNTGACIAAVVSAKIVQAVYYWHMVNLKVFGSIQ
jgi:uncharacterized membrane protein YeaQ/YmgE (transglycosylase-associated protein family)